MMVQQDAAGIQHLHYTESGPKKFDQGMRLQTRGFNLVELMVGIAVVAVLAAAAIPAYQTHVRRSKVSNLFHLISRDTQALQADIDSAGLPTNQTEANSMVARIGELSACTSTIQSSCTFNASGINITLTTEVSDPAFTFHVLPGYVNNQIVWVCGNGTGASDTADTRAQRDKIMPLNCRQVITDAKTTAGLTAGYTVW